jgi:exopolysaccharide biosynthesis polyprenyl glycosylphosphotransferase
MHSKKQKDFFIPLLKVAGDAIAVEVSFIFCYWLRFYSSFTNYVPVTSGFPPFEAYFFSSLCVLPIWLLLFQNDGMFAPRRILYFSDEFFSIIRLVLIGMVFVLAGTFFYRSFSYSRVVFVLITMVSIVFISFERFLLLHFERFWYTKGRDLKNVVIVGSHPAAFRLLSFFHHQKKFGYNAIGYFSVSGKQTHSMYDAPFLGSLRSIPGYIETHSVDVLLLAFNESEHHLLPQLIRECQGFDVEMMMIPDILELMTSNVRVRHFDDLLLLGIKMPALTTWNAIVKRTFDILFASFIFLLISPLFLFLMILVKLDSRGPAFFYQERVGLDGRPFRVIKFRSMKVDAEKRTGPVWASKNDLRATRIGRFLRRFSLDELPQLMNVLKGDMSVVGPRPERPYFVEKFKKEIPNYLDRHRVKSGMTGWAQVSGLRGNAPISERTKYDLYYVENWSLVFDLKIISKTIYAVVFGHDAY